VAEAPIPAVMSIIAIGLIGVVLLVRRRRSALRV
jgi:hypothetical protein